MDIRTKIYIAGHTGLVGSALVRTFQKNGFQNLILEKRENLDLLKQDQVEDFFSREKPEIVILAAAKVGGIFANSRFPAEFIYQNLTIQTHVIHAAWKYDVKKLFFMGSSCVYPNNISRAIQEDDFLAGPLEPTNEAYAMAKISGIKMCQAYNQQYNTRFFCAMPTNLYGPQDHYHPEHSHVLPALIHKIHVAKKAGYKKLVLWGTGNPYREFLYSDDLADACLHLLNLDDAIFDTAFGFGGRGGAAPIINLGTGQDLTIRDLAKKIKKIIGYSGEIIWDHTKPDGTFRKLLDVSKIEKLGWKYQTNLDLGLEKTYRNYLENVGC